MRRWNRSGSQVPFWAARPNVLKLHPSRRNGAPRGSRPLRIQAWLAPGVDNDPQIRHLLPPSPSPHDGDTPVWFSLAAGHTWHLLHLKRVPGVTLSLARRRRPWSTSLRSSRTTGFVSRGFTAARRARSKQAEKSIRLHAHRTSKGCCTKLPRRRSALDGKASYHKQQRYFSLSDHCSS